MGPQSASCEPMAAIWKVFCEARRRDMKKCTTVHLVHPQFMSYMNSNMTVHRDKDFSYILTLFFSTMKIGSNDVHFAV